MRIYLNEDGKKSQKYIDVNIWSFLKASVIASVILTAIVYGIIGVIFLLSYLAQQIISLL